MAQSDKPEKVQRFDDLKAMLDDRRRVITAEIERWRSEQEKKRNGEKPEEGTLEARLLTLGMEIPEDTIDAELIQMREDTLVKIDEALARLQEGRFGYCVQCGDEISVPRLRALPFAVRCKDCEDERQTAIARDRAISHSATAGFVRDFLGFRS